MKSKNRRLKIGLFLDNFFPTIDGVVMVVDNSESMWSMQDLRNDAMSTVLEKSVKGDDINIGCVYFADGDGVDNNGIYKENPYLHSVALFA